MTADAWSGREPLGMHHYASLAAFGVSIIANFGISEPYIGNGPRELLVNPLWSDELHEETACEALGYFVDKLESRPVA